jgi:uncharacterized protein YecE (DUF72 family)
MKAGRVYIGTSGWSYKSWGKSFYPVGVSPGRQLQFYATQFPTVEVNGTFYCLPTQKTFSTWNQEAPPGFLYSIKGSRAVTHFKRLRPGAKSFKNSVNPLAFSSRPPRAHPVAVARHAEKGPGSSPQLFAAFKPPGASCDRI